MKKVFDWESFKINTGIKWWEKILLWFKKPYYGCDYGYKDDFTVEIVAKNLFGKIYIIEEYRIDNSTVGNTVNKK